MRFTQFCLFVRVKNVRKNVCFVGYWTIKQKKTIYHFNSDLSSPKVVLFNTRRLVHDEYLLNFEGSGKLTKAPKSYDIFYHHHVYLWILLFIELCYLAFFFYANAYVLAFQTINKVMHRPQFVNNMLVNTMHKLF